MSKGKSSNAEKKWVVAYRDTVKYYDGPGGKLRGSIAINSVLEVLEEEGDRYGCEVCTL